MDYDEIEHLAYKIFCEFKPSLTELQNELKILRMQNQQILSLLRNNKNGTVIEKSLPDDVTSFIGQSILITNTAKVKAHDFAYELAEETGGTLFSLDEPYYSEGDMASILNNRSDNDYLFIDTDITLLSTEMISQIVSSIEKGSIELRIGSGEGMRTFSLDLPKVHFVIQTMDISILPATLIEKMVVL